MSNAESKLVHAHVWNPADPQLFFKSKKTDHAGFYTVSCTMSERCELIKRGQCAARKLIGGGCLYGQAHRESGPTQRHKGFREWIATHKETEKEVGCLEAPAQKLAKVGDMIYLPYAHMDHVIVGQTNIIQGYDAQFIPASEFTVDKIVFLCSAVPRTIFENAPIRDYQAVSVPLFVSHLAEDYPKLLAEAAEKSGVVAAIVTKLTKVGRKALLSTLNPNVGNFDGWAWDGEYLVANDKKNLIWFTKFGAMEAKIKPAPDAVVTITDNAQVRSDTIFVD